MRIHTYARTHTPWLWTSLFKFEQVIADNHKGRTSNQTMTINSHAPHNSLFGVGQQTWNMLGLSNAYFYQLPCSFFGGRKNVSHKQECFYSNVLELWSGCFFYQIRSWIVWNLAGRLLFSALFLCVSFCLFVLLVVCLWCSKRFLPRNVVKQKTEIWQPVAWSKTCTRRKSRWLAYKMVAFPKKKSKWRLLFLFCWLFSWVGWCLARIIYQPWASNFCLNKSVTQQAGQ